MKALVRRRSTTFHIGDDQPICDETGDFEKRHVFSERDELCSKCKAFMMPSNGLRSTLDKLNELSYAVDKKVQDLGGIWYTQSTLTQNGSNSLVITLNNQIWRNAGIDYDDPGSIGMYYLPNENAMILDLEGAGFE